MIVIVVNWRCPPLPPVATVTVAVPIMVAPDVGSVALAVIVTTQLEVAQPTAVAKPDEFMVATLVVLDTQVTAFVRSCVVGGAV